MTRRSETWSRYNDLPLRVNQEVFNDMFKLVFNTIEKEPQIMLANVIDIILKILEMK